MITTAKIINYDGELLTIKPNALVDRELLQKQCDDIEIRLIDGREITADQRKKAYAIMRDIAKWSGHDPLYIKAYMKYEFTLYYDIDDFSLSDCDVTTAKEFINYLIDFCFKWDIPTRDVLLNRTDDISRYLYSCLEYKKCAVCNAPADLHHIDTVGMGNNRNKIHNKGKEAIALCRKHYTECHQIGVETFCMRHHIYGIKLDDYLCQRLKIRS